MINYKFLLSVIAVCMTSFVSVCCLADGYTPPTPAQKVAAFLNSSVENMEQMFQIGDLDPNYYYHNALLDYAAITGDLKRVKQLAKCGFNINAKNDGSKTNVLNAAAQSGNLEVVQWLVEKGVDATFKDFSQKTLMHFAAMGGSLDVVRYLQEQGLDINATDRNATTVLHCAAQSGNLELVQWLVKQGLDVNAKDRFSHTA